MSVTTPGFDHSALREHLHDVSDLESILWVAVAVTLVTDVFTTAVGLQLGLTESNPIALAAIEGWGVPGMVGMKVSAVAVALCCRPLVPPEYVSVVPAGLALPWGAAATINFYMITVVV